MLDEVSKYGVLACIEAVINSINNAAANTVLRKENIVFVDVKYFASVSSECRACDVT